jgi:signal transduction histidine kinase
MPVTSVFLSLALAVAVIAAPAAAQPPAAQASGEKVYNERCKACHEGGVERAPRRADLAQRAHADRVTIVIKDSGVGISPEDMAHIFDPYFTTRRAGTGLGLPISKNIIEGLGGTPAVSSRRGEGTEIRIDLPQRAPGTHE